MSEMTESGKIEWDNVNWWRVLGYGYILFLSSLCFSIAVTGG